MSLNLLDRKLSTAQIKHLVLYKYSGGDSSLLYKYILSPMAELVVHRLTPRSAAPNLITLIGLLWSLFALACTLLVNPNLNTTEHRYLHLITALCVLLYQLFDNMDGKQARRIGASSPLGMLFDHGCDAINSTVISIPVAAALGTGWTPKLFFCLWCGYVPFYVQTWEEYYVGAMVLPVINGPSEGLVIAAGMCFLSYTYGVDWWHKPLFDVPVIDISMTHFGAVCSFGVIGALVTISSQINSVRGVRRHNGSTSKALSGLLPFLFFPFSFLYCLKSELALSQYPIATVVLMGSIFVEVSTHIMFAHLTGLELRPAQRYLAALPVLLVLRSYTPTDTFVWLDEGSLLSLASLTSLVYASFQLYKIMSSVALALDLHVLTVKDSPSLKDDK